MPVYYPIFKKNAKLQEKTVTENYVEVTADQGYDGLSKVTVNVVGGGGGGAELNIAYGDTAPEDTTKLWVKTTKPSEVIISTNPDYEAIPANTITELSATLQTANWRMDAAAVGKKVYIFGGNLGAAIGSKKVQCFDTITNTLSVLPIDMPHAMNNMCCATYNGKIYLFGGNNEDDANSSTSVATGTITRFDPDTLSFEVLPVSLPENRLGSWASCVGSKIYIFGGHNGDASVNTIFCFDCDANTVTTLTAKLPHKVNRGTSAPVGTKIYIFYYYNMSAICCIFDTESEICTQTSFKNPTSNTVNNDLNCSAVGEKIYLHSCFNTYCVEYDISSGDTAMIGSIPNDLDDHVSAAVDGKVYIFGGKNTNSTPYYSNKIYCHNPMGGKNYLVEENDLLIIPKLETATVPIINSDAVKIEIGVDGMYKGNEQGKGDGVEAAIYKDGTWTTI